MIVGFSGHGTGGGRGPTGYMTDEKREGREEHPPVVVRGDADNTRQLIDSLDFKHKYTSGVLSFAPNEEITPRMEQKIMDRFESMAFAGLEQDQYNILWVRHTHAGHHELHFVTPRVELSSGKSLNIKPPGKGTQKQFDDFRSEINARYGLADPTDPDRAKNVSTPDHELKIASEAIRAGLKPKDDIRTLIDQALTERAVQGLIRSREDVVSNINDLGLSVTRQGKDYITVSEPESGQRWRMKGALYERQFEPSRTIEKADQARARDYSKPDADTAEHFANRVEQHITTRARHNKKRYPQPERKHRLERDPKPRYLADTDRPEPLRGFVRRELDDDALLHEADNRRTRGSDHAGKRGGQDQADSLRGQAETVRSGRQESRSLRGKGTVHDTGRVLIDDGIRNAIIDRIEAVRQRIQSAKQSLRESANSIARNVRDYLTGEQAFTGTSQRLERSIAKAQPALKVEPKIEISKGYRGMSR